MKHTLLVLFTATASSLCSAAERETGDYNFDGHQDYRVFRESDGRLHFYDFYLFDPRTKKYVLSKELSQLFNPQFDAATKEIHCFSPGGHGGAIFIREDYRWEDKRLVFVRVIQQTDISFEVGSYGYIRVTATLKDGKPVIESIEPITKEPYIP
jgi:hypothetical protein